MTRNEGIDIEVIYAEFTTVFSNLFVNAHNQPHLAEIKQFGGEVRNRTSYLGALRAYRVPYPELSSVGLFELKYTFLDSMLLGSSLNDQHDRIR